MGVLQRFERRLEALVEGAFGRAFGGWVEPVEVAAALTREADDRKTILAAGRVLVPNTYVVELGRSDADRLREYDEPLRTELAAMVQEAATEHGWSFVGPVEVTLLETPDLATGAFRVRSSVVAAPTSEATTGPRLQIGTATHPLAAVTVIGRGVECDVQLTDGGVSRRHAQLTPGPDGITLEDLESTNGTWIDGRRIHSAVLHDGDSFTVGTTELVVRTTG